MVGGLTRSHQKQSSPFPKTPGPQPKEARQTRDTIEQRRVRDPRFSGCWMLFVMVVHVCVVCVFVCSFARLVVRSLVAFGVLHFVFGFCFWILFLTPQVSRISEGTDVPAIRSKERKSNELKDPQKPPFLVRASSTQMTPTTNYHGPHASSPR